MIVTPARRRTHNPLRDDGAAVHRALADAAVAMRNAEMRVHFWSDAVAQRVDRRVALGADRMSDPEYQLAEQLVSNLVRLHDLVASQLQVWTSSVERDGTPRPPVTADPLSLITWVWRRGSGWCCPRCSFETQIHGSALRHERDFRTNGKCPEDGKP